jgi:dipeptidyl aminopeptidase/acylaminoacyl peptidase
MPRGYWGDEGGIRMRGMTPDDVYELTGVADPRVSPDGRTIAYVVWRVDKESNETLSNVWVAATDGTSPPRQFTFGPKRDADPRWSPDGSRLAFTSKREEKHKGEDKDPGKDSGKDSGKEKVSKASQLYVIPLAGGEALKLTERKEDVGAPVWSPDGTRLAFTSRVPDEAYEEKEDKKRKPRRVKRLQYKLDNEGWTVDRPRHVFTVAADGSAPAEQLTDGEFEDDNPAWSPDGARIAFSSARHEDWDIGLLLDIYAVAGEGGEPEKLTATDGQCWFPSWSPDGKRIAYLFNPGDMEPFHTQVAVLDLGTKERRILTGSLDRNCAPYFSGLREPLWNSGTEIVFGVEDKGNVHVYRVGTDGSDPEAMTGGDLMATGYDVVAGQLVESRTTPTSLSELFAGERQLTEVGKSFTDGRELVAPERFTALSTGGAEVEAWVMRPAEFEEGKKYPMLLNIHGGPFGQYGNKFFDEFQVYAGAGYVVVYPNPRGSSGYSEEWARAIRGPVDGGGGWGSVDYDDCMAVVDEALKRFDFIDQDRLGVMGGSYGGYMTSWIVGHTDRFQAAISERSVNQWVSMWGSSDYGWDYKGYTGGFLFEDFETWVKQSPSTYAQQITTPLLILHSENDLRCPVEQGEHLFVTLRLLKRDVEMVRFPGEGHELTRSGSPFHRATRFEIVIDWLKDRLQNH